MLKSLLAKITKQNKALPGQVACLSMHGNELQLAILDLGPNAKPILKHLHKIADFTWELNQLSQLAQDFNLQQMPLALLLTPKQYRFLLIDAPQVPEAEMLDAARWLIKDLIDFPVEEAVLDGFVVPYGSTNRAQKKFYLSVAHLQTLQPMVDKLLAAGISLSAILVPELALTNFFSSKEQTGAHGLLYLAEQEGIIVLAHENTFCFTRKINLNINELEQPESANLNNLSLELQRSLDYFESQLRLPGIQKLLLVSSQSPAWQEQLCINLSKQLTTQLTPLQLTTVIDNQTTLAGSELYTYIAAIGGGIAHAATN